MALGSLGFVLAPVLAWVFALAQATARGRADRDADAARGRQVTWFVALVQIGLAVHASTVGGLEVSRFAWLPELGMEFVWRVDPLGALLVALGACCLPTFVAEASLGRRLGAGLIHGGAGLLVAGEDLGSVALGIALVGVGRAWVISELPAPARSSARQSGWRAARETALAISAAMFLLFLVAASYQEASRGVWSTRYDQLLGISFPAQTQSLHLLVLIAALAPGLSLWPAGVGARAVAAGPHAPIERWLHALIMAASAFALLRGGKVLAPRMVYELAPWLWGLAFASCSFALAVGRIDPERGGSGPHFAVLPLLVPVFVDGPWAERAFALASLALLLGALAPRGGRSAWVARASATAMPGTIGFAALVATWVALYQAHAVAPLPVRLLCGLALTLATWARVPRRTREDATIGDTTLGVPHWDERWLRGFAAVLILVGGLVPSRVLERLLPFADAQAAEVELRRCADLELWELSRPRLRAEMEIDCTEPAVEIEDFYARGVGAAAARAEADGENADALAKPNAEASP